MLLFIQCKTACDFDPRHHVGGNVCTLLNLLHVIGEHGGF